MPSNAPTSDSWGPQTTIPQEHGLHICPHPRKNVYRSFYALTSKVPLHRRPQPHFKPGLGFPSQFPLDLGGVDGVAAVMTGAVLHEGLELAAGALGALEVPVHQVAEAIHQGQVGLLVVAAHAVGFSGHARAHHRFQGGAVVLHKQPVADVQAVAVDGNGLALGHAGDGQGDELFRVLAGAVVVGAVGRHSVQAVGVVVGPHQVVAARLAGAVGAVGGVGHGFMELAGVAQ